MNGSGLAKKLLIKPGQRIAIINAPADYSHGDLPENVEVTGKLDTGTDFVHLFVKDRSELERFVPTVLKNLKHDGMLWICYPKGTSKIKTDLNRDILWREIEKHGMAGVSLVSIDSVWSAMRFRPTDKVGK